MQYDSANDIKSLRHMNDFEMFLMKLCQNYTTLIVDTEYEDDKVTPDKEPEASFS